MKTQQEIFNERYEKLVSLAELLWNKPEEERVWDDEAEWVFYWSAVLQQKIIQDIPNRLYHDIDKFRRALAGTNIHPDFQQINVLGFWYRRFYVWKAQILNGKGVKVTLPKW